MQDVDQTNKRDLRESIFFKSKVCIQIITLTSLVDHAGEQEAQVHQAFVLELRIDAYSAEDAMEMSFSSKAALDRKSCLSVALLSVGATMSFVFRFFLK